MMQFGECTPIDELSDALRRIDELEADGVKMAEAHAEYAIKAHNRIAELEAELAKEIKQSHERLASIAIHIEREKQLEAALREIVNLPTGRDVIVGQPSPKAIAKKALASEDPK